MIPGNFIIRGDAGGSPTRITIALYHKLPWGGAHSDKYHRDLGGTIRRGLITPKSSYSDHRQKSGNN